MPRRRPQANDSLELLLDTICNTFGGVLFIAILVVILLQMSGEQSPTDSADPASESSEELAMQLRQLSFELSSRQATRDSQEQLVEKFAPDQVRRLVEERNRLRQASEQLRRRRDELLAGNVELQSTVDRARREADELQKSIGQAQRDLAERKSTLASDRRARTSDVLTPLVRAAEQKREIGVILRYGRLYVWHDYDQFGNRLGLNEKDFVVVGEESGALLTRPNPVRGLPLSDDETSRAAIRGQLGRFSPQTCYITVIVRSDSFEQFRCFRTTLVKLGFQYRLLPLADGAAIMDRGGRGGAVQ